MALRKGRIVKVHPGDHSVDIMMVDDGSRLTGVQVATMSGGTRSGVHDLPYPDERDDDKKWDLTDKKDSDAFALVDFVNGRNPVVMGYLFPQINQMNFDEQGRRLNRHGSDVYSTIDKNGNAEIYHPSGAYIRMGTSPDHEDLTKKDSDKAFEPSRNTDKKIHIHIQQAGNTASIDIDPDGNVTITNKGNTTVTTDGNTSVQTKGTTNIHSDGDMTLSSSSHIQLNAPRIDLN